MRKIELSLSWVRVLLLMLGAGPIGSFAQEKTAADDHAEIVLIANGKSLSPIILPTEPTLFTKIAAADLAEYLGKVPSTTRSRPDKPTAFSTRNHGALLL